MFSTFQKMSIKYRLMGWFSISIILTLTVVGGVIYSQSLGIIEKNIISELAAITDATRNMVQTAARVSVRNRLRAIAEKNVDILTGLNAEVQKGNMSEGEARELAKKILLSQTVGTTGYIYCVSSKGIVEVHPNAAMQGYDISNIWLGKEQARRRTGYMEYDWANPGETKTRSKALYMEYFSPWDWIVSVSSYREEFSTLIDIDDFRMGLDALRIFDSGYVFIVNGKGEMVFHPWLMGDMSQSTDANGDKLFAKLVSERNGQLVYDWKDPDRESPRKKLMLFRYIPELDWIVASASYYDEVYAPLTQLRNILLSAALLGVVCVLLLGYYLGTSISRPLSRLTARMQEAHKGDLSIRAGVDGQGEVGELAMHFNQYMRRLEDFRDELRSEIDERIRAEQQLKLFEMVFENALEGISITDRNGNIVAVNPSFTSITGYQPSEVLGKNPRVLKSERHDTMFYGDMWASLAKKGMWQGEIWNRRKNGESFPEILSISSVRNSENEVSHYVAVFNDISDLKLKDEQITHQFYHDGLTGLPNRSLAEDRLGVAITHANRKGHKVAFFSIDLDNFKKINDAMGHARGDILIKDVADRLRELCKAEDTIARIGGDEYTIMVEDVVDERDVVDLADRLLRAFDAPFIINGDEIFVTPSIGVALYPEDGEDSGTLIKNADMAMYQSKARGKNSYFLFTQEMSERVFKRIQLENDMRQALKERAFRVYFQPKVDLKSGIVSGVEALVRWIKPDGTVISPAAFIPLAEETGLIVPLGEFVLEAACMAMQVLDGIGCTELTVAVNLSPVQFEQEDLIEMILANLNRNGLAPERLELEVTESTLMTNVESSIATLNQLADEGISIAIDDFGTGYSSLYYLKNFPIDVLKVDQSFVRDITVDASDAKIVETIILMARNLGLSVVAEGVETKEQLDLLASFGCEKIQGYYFSKPLPLELLIKYLVKDGSVCLLKD